MMNLGDCYNIKIDQRNWNVDSLVSNSKQSLLLSLLYGRMIDRMKINDSVYHQ